MGETLRLGEVVYVWWLPGLIRHYGVVVWEACLLGEEPIIRTVYPGGKAPVNETLSQFRKGRNAYKRSYPSNLNGWEVAQNALFITDFEYDLFKLNCEHFYKRAHGLPEISEQVIVGAIFITAAGLYFTKGRVPLPA